MFWRSGRRSPVADRINPPQGNWPLVPSPEPGVFVVAYEMALTPAELHRLAVHLEGGAEMERGERFAAARLPDGRAWRITLGPQRERRIALMRFPICDAEIRLEGFERPAAEAFLARFHKVFQKGGG
jgi:hypothetical protein